MKEFQKPNVTILDGKEWLERLSGKCAECPVARELAEAAYETMQYLDIVDGEIGEIKASIDHIDPSIPKAFYPVEERTRYYTAAERVSRKKEVRTAIIGRMSILSEATTEAEGCPGPEYVCQARASLDALGEYDEATNIDGLQAHANSSTIKIPEETILILGERVRGQMTIH